MHEKHIFRDNFRGRRAGGQVRDCVSALGFAKEVDKNTRQARYCARAYVILVQHQISRIILEIEKIHIEPTKAGTETR